MNLNIEDQKQRKILIDNILNLNITIDESIFKKTRFFDDDLEKSFLKDEKI